MDPELGLLALARANRINFDVAGEPVWFLFYFEDSVLYDPRTFENLGRSAIMHLAASVRFRDEWRDDGMGVVFAQTALDQCRRYGTDLFQLFHIPSLP